jgi:hypothetical protein
MLSYWRRKNKFDADPVIRLFDGGRQLSKLIGRATPPMAASVAAMIK